MAIFAAKYDGKASKGRGCTCGADVRQGDRIEYLGGKVTRCPACWNGSAAVAVVAPGPGPAVAAPTPTATPRAKLAPKAPRRALPSPSADEAATTLRGLLARLDPWQSKIAAWRPGAGNLRAVAGAGSGKTTTAVALVGSLVAEGVGPSSIIATTFTRKAGNELQERLARVLPPGALSLMRVGTFHALAGRIVDRAMPGRFARDRNLDGDHRAEGVPSAAALWEKILGWAGPDGVPGTRAEGLGLEDPEVRSYMLAADVARSHPGSAADIAARLAAAERAEGLPHLATAWAMYLDAKRALGAYDFADLIAALHEGLVAGSITDGARVVIVDEAQDNSEIMLAVAILLARNGQGEVILVGDVRQSIYGWRGAFPELFREADARIGAGSLELPVNYRSGAKIVALGNAIADGKAWALGAATKPGRDAEGTVTVQGYGSVSEEADGVAADIAAAAAAGASLDSCAILCRTNAQAAAFEAGLVKARIPCVVVGGTPFFTRREVADFLAYVTLSTRDDADALARIVNRPKRMLGKVFVASVVSAAGATLAEKVANAAAHCRTYGQRGAGRDLAALLSRLRAGSWGEAVVEIGRLLAPPESRGGAADEDRAGLVAAAATLASTFESADAFLAFAARCAGEVERAGADDDLPAGRVVISTIHKAKGLEWASVYVSASFSMFPHARAVGPRAEEEERLFYVAVTRAKDALHLTYSNRGLKGGEAGPSPFLAHADSFVPPPPEGPGGGERATVGADGVVETAAGAVLTEREDERSAVEMVIDAVRAGEIDTGGKPRIVAQVAAMADAARRAREETAAAAAAIAAVDRDGEAYEVTPGADALAAPAAFPADRWAAAVAVAEAGTAAEPAARPGAGGRYVTVEAGDVAALLSGLGFAQRDEAGQVVFATTGATAKGTALLKVYTSIPVGGEVAREVGEDSIKVAALWHHTGDAEPRPLHKRLPYACRTRGWRLTLLARIREAAQHFAAQPCRRCGAPTVERRKADGTTFAGCVRFRECKAESAPRA